MPREAKQGPSTLGDTHVTGVNAHKHRQAQRRDFYAFTLFLPFLACDGCWRQTRWPWRAAEGPTVAPGPYLCPRSPRLGPEAMLTPAVPAGKWDTKFYYEHSVVALANTRLGSV